MRRLILPIILACLFAWGTLSGCTLVDPTPDQPPVIITATLSDTVALALTPTPTAAHTTTPAPTLTATEPPPTETPAPPTGTATTPPSFTPAPTLAPTRTAPAVAIAAAPLDDGSGRLIAGTSGGAAANFGATGSVVLQESLYFLGPDAGGAYQVFRLRVGMPAPDQITLSATGVSAYDLGPGGTLAYITSDGLLLANGVPVLPPIDLAALPQATALAWAPGSLGWLAFTLRTPGADSTSGPHPVDGVWVRSADGTVSRAAATDYTPGASRIFTGPLIWRPDGLALLVAEENPTGPRWTLLGLASNLLTPLWNDTTLPPDSIHDVAWAADGASILASGAGAILRLVPEPLSAQTLLDRSAGFAPQAVRPHPDGSLIFIGQRDGGACQLYALRPGNTAPTALSSALPGTSGAPCPEMDWDSSGTQAILVTGGSPGTPTLRDQDSVLHDLTALTGGPIAAPQWAPLFRSGDRASVQGRTPINLRSAPDGAVVASLPGGVVVTVRDGPRWVGGAAWWQVQTSDRLTGWVVETVRDDQGQTVRTLLPAP